MVLIAGPNGSGKTTLYEEWIRSRFGQWPFINADWIATDRWGTQGREQHSYDAAKEAANLREAFIQHQTSFVAETVFSHESKIDLVQRAKDAGFGVLFLIVHVDPGLAVERVEDRVATGGHAVPEDKIRKRHARLFRHLAAAIPLADITILFDNRFAGIGPVSVARLDDAGVEWKVAERPEWATDIISRAGEEE